MHQRLAEAINALESFPALYESRKRADRALAAVPFDVKQLVAAIEGDLALTVAVLRAGEAIEDPAARERADSIGAIASLLGPQKLSEAIDAVPTHHFLDKNGLWEDTPERMRRHGRACQNAIVAITAITGHSHPDRLLVAALLHDIGKLVLEHAFDNYPQSIVGLGFTPEQRVAAERETLGLDHAQVGASLCRRWKLPGVIVDAIEQHHAADAGEDGIHLRLADMLEHVNREMPFDTAEMRFCAERIDIEPAVLGSLMYDLGDPLQPQTRAATKNPLSDKEQMCLELLAEGKVYKQIAFDLKLSVSTVRTHLHNIYRKLDAVDRAQAVLIATRNGWLPANA